MKRQVLWGRPEQDRVGNAVRASKCGRFVVRSKRMASGRNGHWNARAYAAERGDGIRIGKLHDSLQEALDAVEYANDPNWEPS